MCCWRTDCSTRLSMGRSNEGTSHACSATCRSLDGGAMLSSDRGGVPRRPGPPLLCPDAGAAPAGTPPPTASATANPPATPATSTRLLNLLMGTPQGHGPRAPGERLRATRPHRSRPAGSSALACCQTQQHPAGFHRIPVRNRAAATSGIRGCDRTFKQVRTMQAGPHSTRSHASPDQPCPVRACRRPCLVRRRTQPRDERDLHRRRRGIIDDVPDHAHH